MLKQSKQVFLKWPFFLRLLQCCSQAPRRLHLPFSCDFCVLPGQHQVLHTRNDYVEWSEPNGEIDYTNRYQNSSVKRCWSGARMAGGESTGEVVPQDVDHRYAYMAAIITLTVVSVLIAWLRVYTRVFISRNPGWDDWVMLISTVSSAHDQIHSGNGPQC